jgi:hypothetical protein
VSIILDEKSLALFPRSAFESGALKLASHTPWKAITLTLGASPCIFHLKSLFIIFVDLDFHLFFVNNKFLLTFKMH